MTYIHEHYIAGLGEPLFISQTFCSFKLNNLMKYAYQANCYDNDTVGIVINYNYSVINPPHILIHYTHFMAMIHAIHAPPGAWIK